ncbi:M14 family metallopeptidase [Listeria ivanovii]|uniref:hypothetical protein n=1 Tax=Listeria ivanovii TaxID=1638 RepID=UPI00190449F2|nr:hypothetical protein [Listeria ivanovii]
METKNVEMGSIMAFCVKSLKDIASNIKIYEKSVPVNFISPSLYFPQPTVSGASASLSSFRNVCVWNIKVFDTDKAKAFQIAEAIRNAFYSRRLIIPILKPDGIESGFFIRLKSVDIRDNDEFSKSLVINWNSYERYQTETKAVLNDDNPLQINGGMKNG